MAPTSFFGVLFLLAVAVFAIYMPETRGRSLEGIQVDFHRPELSHLSSLRWPSSIRRLRAASSHFSSEGFELQLHEQERMVVTAGPLPGALRLDGSSV